MGEFFLFLTTASDINPVKIHFRDCEPSLKAKKTSSPWKEKIYMYPAILQRKWTEYKYKEKFIPSTSYDNVLPFELNYDFINPVGIVTQIKLKTIDKHYKRVTLMIINRENELFFKKTLYQFSLDKEEIIDVSIKIPGIYRIIILTDENSYSTSDIIFYHTKHFFSIPEMNTDQFDDAYSRVKKYGKKADHYCNYCKCRIYPAKAKVISGFDYKNYIPFKEYIDIETLGIEYITSWIMKIDHPAVYKRGLIHLLNMIRLSSIEDELTIITNLFKDDPSFAYFITDKLFLFSMIPLMVDRELQKILNTIDDISLARSLAMEEKSIVDKVLKNVSTRRANIITDEINSGIPIELSEKAKNDLHKHIRSYFEERIGRSIRIPSAEKLVYYEKDFSDQIDAMLIGDIPYHSGDFLSVFDTDLFRCAISEGGENCLLFDVESYKDKIATVAGVSDSAVYLKSEIGIRYALIHVYNWVSNLEDYEYLENISRHMIIPFSYTSSRIILTIGAIDSKSNPLEQVIRIKIR
jgi:hypothetical protein